MERQQRAGEWERRDRKRDGGGAACLACKNQGRLLQIRPFLTLACTFLGRLAHTGTVKRDGKRDGAGERERRNRLRDIAHGIE